MPAHLGAARDPLAIAGGGFLLVVARRFEDMAKHLDKEGRVSGQELVKHEGAGGAVLQHGQEPVLEPSDGGLVGIRRTV